MIIKKNNQAIFVYNKSTMYTPKQFVAKDQQELIDFMTQFSFATIVTAKHSFPVATHLPFAISVRNEKVFLRSHFAKANPQWKDITDGQVLVIFTEPHAYISPKNYDKVQEVPTWNYFSVHAYGTTKLVTDDEGALQILEDMILSYDVAYQSQWEGLSQDYKLKMIKGIVAFEIEVNDLQAAKKMSQNKTVAEQERIITSLSESDHSSDKLMATYMKKNLDSSAEK